MSVRLFEAISIALVRERPSSRNEFIYIIRRIFGTSLKTVIDAHNTSSIIFVYGNSSPALLLKAELGISTATHKEIGWYEALKDNPDSPGAPYIKSYATDSFALLLLQYIQEARTIDEVVFEKNSCSTLMPQYIQRAFELDALLFTNTVAGAARETVDQFFIRKYNQRRREAGSTAYLDMLLSSRTIHVNGKKLLTPDQAIARIISSPSVYRYLTPTKIGLIHGDLHCGNILINSDQLYFIDPNGCLAMPLEYDVGKLLHSVHGYYPSIVRGNFVLQERVENDYIFTVKTNAVYNDAHYLLRKHLSHDEYARGVYAEALHFATMLPHHARRRRETTALFLRSMELFDELFIIIDLKTGRHGKRINSNSI